MLAAVCLMGAIYPAGPMAGLSAQAEPTVVEAVLGGQSARLSVSRHHAFAAVNAADLDRFWNGISRSGVFLRVGFAGADLVFEAGSPFFRYRDNVQQLANPPYEWGGAFWLPADFVTGWMAEVGRSVAIADEPEMSETPLPARVNPGVPWHVIIDPGHGGRDPGTLGRASREKDVVLSIGRLVLRELEGRPDVVPFLTRDTDVYVKHDLRSQFAVDQEGDLFVSIHANAATDHRARGFETIFLGPARSEEAREVALRENRGPSLEDAAEVPEDVQFILTGLDRTENLSESRRFAGFVQNSIRDVRGRGSPDRGVKQGPWWVLLGALARMPSVIVEVGFLSNQGEETYLTSADGQRVLARAIADAIVEYREDMLSRYAVGDGRRD